MNDHVATPFREILASFVRPVTPPEPPPPQHYSHSDVRRYRSLEAHVYQQLAAELEAAGRPIDAGTLAWVVDEALDRLSKAVSR